MVKQFGWIHKKDIMCQGTKKLCLGIRPTPLSGKHFLR